MPRSVKKGPYVQTVCEKNWVKRTALGRLDPLGHINGVLSLYLIWLDCILRCITGWYLFQCM